MILKQSHGEIYEISCFLPMPILAWLHYPPSDRDRQLPKKRNGKIGRIHNKSRGRHNPCDMPRYFKAAFRQLPNLNLNYEKLRYKYSKF